MTSLGAIVLAAGRGRRVGKPKALLEFQGRSYLSIVVSTLAEVGVDPVVIVVSPEIENDLSFEVVRAKCVVNPDPDRGMVSSVRIGCEALPDVDGWLLVPVDHPFVRRDTYEKLTKAFSAHGACIIKPVLNGHGGHPMIIPKRLAQELPAHDVEGGLRMIVRASGLPVVAVPVSDPGVLRNVNEAADLV